MQSKTWNSENTQYVLFKEINPETRLHIIHSNNIKNIEGKFKVLENININNKEKQGNKEVFLQDCILKVEYKGKRIFAIVK